MPWVAITSSPSTTRRGGLGCLVAMLLVAIALQTSAGLEWTVWEKGSQLPRKPSCRTQPLPRSLNLPPHNNTNPSLLPSFILLLMITHFSNISTKRESDAHLHFSSQRFSLFSLNIFAPRVFFKDSREKKRINMYFILRVPSFVAVYPVLVATCNSEFGLQIASGPFGFISGAKFKSLARVPVAKRMNSGTVPSNATDQKNRFRSRDTWFSKKQSLFSSWELDERNIS